MSTDGVATTKAYKAPQLDTEFTRSFPGVLELAARLALVEPSEVLPPAPRVKGTVRARAFLAWLCRRTRPEMSWKEIAAKAGLDWTGMRAAFLKLDEKRRDDPALSMALRVALEIVRDEMKREVAAE